MHEMPTKSPHATCRCGKVSFGVTGAPIFTASCYCASCQQAGHQFESLPSAPPLRDADGGTPMVLYRKDRVRCVTGLEYLEEKRLTAQSPTRRVFATCCNSAMFLDFTKGHWLSLYRSRFAPDAPPLEMRIMTKDRSAGVVLGNDVPNYEGHPGKFILKLIAAWIAMGFAKPDMGLGDISRPLAAAEGPPAEVHLAAGITVARNTPPAPASTVCRNACWTPYLHW